MRLPQNDDELLLLHNPRCSKSRQVKAKLEEMGVAFTERRYLDDPLSVEELEELAARLDLPVREWTRIKEGAFREAGLSEDAPDSEWIAAIAERPVLMERPILIRGRRARVGRPPEVALELARARR